MEFKPQDIQLGGLAPKLHQQMGLEPADVEIEQKALDALDFLRVQGILPSQTAWTASNKVVERALKRLLAEGLIEPVEPAPGGEKGEANE